MTSLRSSGVRRLNALLRQAREPIFVLDPQGRLAFVNPAWEALTGRDPGEMAGPSEPNGADPPVPDPAADALVAGFSPPPEALAGRPAGGPALIAGPRGERLLRRVEYWPYHDEHGQLLGLLGMVRDAASPPHAPESEALRARAELAELREALRDRLGIDDLMGRGPRHERLIGQIEAAAGASSSVLVAGEPGTGRGLVARLIHRLGPRPEAPLIPLDVQALVPEVLARELDRATTEAGPGAVSIRMDEALDLPRDLQASVVDAIRARRLRVLATTRADPEARLREGAIREDYYYALTGQVIRLAPLRERLDELPTLADYLLERANRRGTRRRSGFDPSALEALRLYDWPGNLAELARVIEAARDRGEGDAITKDDLPADVRGELAGAYLPPPMPSAVTPLDQWLTQLERKLIEQALHRARQNKSRAAELLAISRPRLYRRIKELDIPHEPDGGEGPE